MNKQNQFSAPLFAIGAVVALAGILTNLPAAQVVMSAAPEAAGGVQQQLLTWLASLAPAVLVWIGEQVYAAMKSRGVNVGPIANVHNAIQLTVSTLVNQKVVAKVVVHLKGGQELPFVIDEAPVKPAVRSEVLS